MFPLLWKIVYLSWIHCSFICNDNIYCQQQASKKGRHIVTPEQGMFIGPDQTERSRRDRERKIEYLKDLEKVSAFGIM